MEKEFKDAMVQLKTRIEKVRHQLDSEESVKTAVILPLFQTLGYDVFDPSVFKPEFTADVGIKRGEKVDYALLENGAPFLLVECKPFGQKLTAHHSQLFRYFSTTTARFALLTNGHDLHFYSDTTASNVMDGTPFFECNLLNMSDADIDVLEWFHAAYFILSDVLPIAKNLKYKKELRAIMLAEWQKPSVDFVKFWINKIYAGKMTDKAVKELTPIVEQTLVDLFTPRI
jgi:predicted type IV restriction endonuclease